MPDIFLSRPLHAAIQNQQRYFQTYNSKCRGNFLWQCFNDWRIVWKLPFLVDLVFRKIIWLRNSKVPEVYDDSKNHEYCQIFARNKENAEICKSSILNRWKFVPWHVRFERRIFECARLPQNLEWTSFWLRFSDWSKNLRDSNWTKMWNALSKKRLLDDR